MSTEGEEEGWEYYDDNEVLPDFWQVRHICTVPSGVDGIWPGRNSPGFDPSILRHSGIGAANEAVLNKN